MSGETVLHPEDIQWISENCTQEPKYRTGFDRNLWIWKNYEPSSTYLMTADVARGDGRDYSAFHIIDLSTMEQVAEYQGKPDIDMFSEILKDVGKEYGNCMIVVENNNVGFAVLEKLLKASYPNVYHSVKSTHEYVDQHIAEYQSNTVPGFTTSMKTRPLIVAKLEEFIRNKLLTIRSLRSLNEFKTFIWNQGKAQAMREYNDDLVMCLAIGCWVRDTVLVDNQRDIEYREAFLNTMTRSNSVLNTTIPGMRGHMDINKSNNIQEMKEYMWLIKG